MSLWQMAAAVQGWNRAQKAAAGKTEPPGEDVTAALIEDYNRRHGTNHGR